MVCAVYHDGALQALWISHDGSSAAWASLQTSGAAGVVPNAPAAGVAAGGDLNIPAARFHHTATVFAGDAPTSCSMI